MEVYGGVTVSPTASRKSTEASSSPELTVDIIGRGIRIEIREAATGKLLAKVNKTREGELRVEVMRAAAIAAKEPNLAGNYFFDPEQNYSLAAFEDPRPQKITPEIQEYAEAVKQYLIEPLRQTGDLDKLK